MLIQEGVELSTIDVNGEPCTGKVVCFLRNTFIIEHETDDGSKRYLILKSRFCKEGYTFPQNDAKRNFNNYAVL